MKVLLRNPRREVDLPGPLTVAAVLKRLAINPETVIVIRHDTLLTKDEQVGDADEIELRPVISGGSETGLGPLEAARTTLNGPNPSRGRPA